MKQVKNIIVGCFEPVSFDELGIANELAKIDTGAFSGAIHCTNIRVVRRGIRRKRYLRFTPMGSGSPQYVTKFRKIKVRSSTGHNERRYTIATSVTLRSQTYPIQIGLSDRSDMKKNILIGRRFLRENDMLVDVRLNMKFDDEKGADQ